MSASSSESDEPALAPAVAVPSPADYADETPTSSGDYGEEAPSADTEPAAPPARKKFNPLTDILGIQAADSVEAPAAQQVAVYQDPATVLPGRAALDRTTADRIANVKGMMQHGGGQGMNGGMNGGMGMGQGMQPQHGFGVNNTNAQMQQAARAQQYQHHQMAIAQQQMAAQQQAAMYQSQAAAMYQTAYQTGNPAAAQQALVIHQMGQQQMMMQQQQMMHAQRGLLPGASYNLPQRTHQAVPAMAAGRVQHTPGSYRVKRSTAPTRVSASDTAFGPIVDQMKQAAIRK